MWGSGGSNYAYGFYGEQRELENHGVSSNVNWNRYYNRQEIRKGYGTRSSAPASVPRYEQAGMAWVVHGTSMDRVGPTCSGESGRNKEHQVSALNSKYKSMKIRKTFGYLGQFTGVVEEVWHGEQGIFAHIRYEDGDSEDITLAELGKLVHEPMAHEQISSQNRKPLLEPLRVEKEETVVIPGGSSCLEEKVRENLSRLGRKLNGAQFWKEYQGEFFAGRVRSIVWGRSLGYGAKVVYSDGFEERLTISELESLSPVKNSAFVTKPLAVVKLEQPVLQEYVELRKPLVFHTPIVESFSSQDVVFVEPAQENFVTVVEYEKRCSTRNCIDIFPLVSKAVKRKSPPPGFERSNVSGPLVLVGNIHSFQHRTQVHSSMSLSLQKTTIWKTIQSLFPCWACFLIRIGITASEYFDKRKKMCQRILGYVFFVAQRWLFRGWDPPWI